MRGFDSLQIGVALLSVGCFQLIALAAYSVVARFIDMRLLLVFGLVLFGLGCYLYVPLTNQWGWQELLLPQALRGIGQQFCVPPIVTMALGSLPQSRLRSASGLFNLMRNLGGAIGIAVSSTMLNDRLNLHYERLDEQPHRGPAGGRIACCSSRRAHCAAVGGNVLNTTHAGLDDAACAADARSARADVLRHLLSQCRCVSWSGLLSVAVFAPVRLTLRRRPTHIEESIMKR